METARARAYQLIEQSKAKSKCCLLGNPRNGDFAFLWLGERVSEHQRQEWHRRGLEGLGCIGFTADGPKVVLEYPLGNVCAVAVGCEYWRQALERAPSLTTDFVEFAARLYALQDTRPN